MTYRRPAIVGIATAFVAPVVWLVSKLALPIAFQLIAARRAGSGGIGFVSVDLAELLVVAVVGFIAGFAWQLRRTKRSRLAPPPSPDVP
jgi:hypothetical protein